MQQGESSHIIVWCGHWWILQY